MLILHRAIGCLHVEKSAYFEENDALSFSFPLTFCLEKLNCFVVIVRDETMTLFHWIDMSIENSCIK